MLTISMLILFNTTMSRSSGSSATNALKKSSTSAVASPSRFSSVGCPTTSAIVRRLKSMPPEGSKFLSKLEFLENALEHLNR